MKLEKNLNKINIRINNLKLFKNIVVYSSYL